MRNTLLLACVAGIAHHAAAVTTTSSCLKGRETLLAPLASNSAVLQYCSSHYPVPLVTSTVTATTTTTTTLGSTILTTTTLVDYTTSTSTDVEYATTTISETVTTETVSSFATVTVNQKRDAFLPHPPRATPPAVANLFALVAAAKAEVSHICSCFETPLTTTTTVTQTNTATAISSTTDVIQATSIVTVVPVVTTTETSSTTEFETATTTVYTTSTSTLIPPYCSGTPNAFGGGCSSGCYCDTRNQGAPMVCNNGISCTGACSTDTDCPVGWACINDSATTPCGHPICVPFTGCSSSYSPSKRGLEFMRGSQDSAFVKKSEEVAERDDAVVGVALLRPDGSLS